jgi:hypothetical protein
MGIEAAHNLKEQGQGHVTLPVDILAVFMYGKDGTVNFSCVPPEIGPW